MSYPIEDYEYYKNSVAYYRMRNLKTGSCIGRFDADNPGYLEPWKSLAGFAEENPIDDNANVENWVYESYNPYDEKLVGYGSDIPVANLSLPPVSYAEFHSLVRPLNF